MALQDDIINLRALLTARHGDNGRAVDVSDAPGGVQRFWETIGWSPFMRNFDLVQPETALSEAAIEATLAGWRDQQMSTLTRADLPDRVRMLTRDTAGVGFVVADESTDAVDPPLLAVLCDTNEVRALNDTYLRELTRILIGVSATSVWIRAQPASLLRGKKRFPVLAPSVTTTDLGLRIESRTGGSAFVKNTTKEIFDWLRDAPLTKLELDGLGNQIFLGQGYDFVRARLSEPHELPPWNQGDKLTLGKLGDDEVLLNVSGGGASVHSYVPSNALFYNVHDVAPSSWPISRGPIVLSPSIPDAPALRSMLQSLDPAHGSLDAETDAPSGLATYLRELGRGPLIDDLWPTELCAPGAGLPDGPKRSRRIAHADGWSAFTDEDDGRPDPVAVWQQGQQVALASPRATTFFAKHVERTVSHRLAVTANRHLKGVPWNGDFLSTAQLADGVFVADTITFARDAEAWLSYLETLDEKLVRGAGPPQSYTSSQLVDPTPDDVKKLESLGLRKTKRTDQEYIVAGSQYLGRVRSVPIWVTVTHETRPRRMPKKRLRVRVYYPEADRQVLAGVWGALER